jgi:hypothetical protein
LSAGKSQASGEYGSWGMAGQGKYEKANVTHTDAMMTNFISEYSVLIHMRFQYVCYLFNHHTPIRRHDCTNFAHIFFWKFLATFKSVVTVTPAADFLTASSP